MTSSTPTPQLGSGQAYPNYDLTIDPNQFDGNVHGSLTEGKEKTTAQAKEDFDKAYPEPSNDDAIKQENQNLEVENAQLNKLEDQSSVTQPYVIVKENAPDHKRNPIETLLGIIFLAVMLGACLVIPTLAASLLYDSGTMPLVENTPLLGAIFGLAAMVGVVSSISYRDTLKKDDFENIYDKRIFKFGIGIYLIWVSAFALVLFPIVIGGEIKTDVFGNETLVGALKLSPPKALMILLTAIMDVAAGAVMHIFVISRLTPRILKKPIDDAERLHLDNDLIPEVVERVEATKQKIKGLKQEHIDWKNARNQHVNNCLIIFERRYAQYQVLKAQAVVSFLDMETYSNAPASRSNGIDPSSIFSDPSQSNGHAHS